MHPRIHVCMHSSIHTSHLFIYLSIHRFTCQPSEHLSISSYPCVYFLIHEPTYSSFNGGICCPHLSDGEDGKTRMTRSLCPQPGRNLVHHIQGWPVDVINKSTNSKAFQELREARALCQGKMLGGGVFEAVLTEMREEVCPAYGKTYGFHREPSPREERGTDHRELRGESKASDLHRGSNRRLWFQLSQSLGRLRVEIP